MAPFCKYTLEVLTILKAEIEKSRCLRWETYVSHLEHFEQQLRKAKTQEKRYEAAVEFELEFPIYAPFDLRAKVRLLRQGIALDK